MLIKLFKDIKSRFWGMYFILLPILGLPFALLSIAVNELLGDNPLW